MSTEDIIDIETEQVEQVPVTPTAQPTAPIFRDTAYKSRTLILEDGRAFAVEKSLIEASDPVLQEYLEQHKDFVRVE